MIQLTKKNQDQICTELAQRLRARRKELGLTQQQLADKSGVSLGSLKRFEHLHEISLSSFVKLAISLNCESDLDTVLARRAYRSIDEVIADAESH